MRRADLAALVAKGRLTADAVARTLGRIEPVAALDAAASSRLVVEAIVENLAIKRGLFQQLEAIVAPDCVLATNTYPRDGVSAQSWCYRPAC